MKCYRHPREDALYECANCGKPICGECMRFSEEGDHVNCPECDVDSAHEITESASLEHEDFQQHVQELAGRRLWMERFNVRINGWLLTAILVLFGLYYYFDYVVSQSQEPVVFGGREMMENDSPAAQFCYLLSQIYRFREDKKRWPQELEDLYPKFIESRPRILKTDEKFVFAADPQFGFVFSIPKAERFHFLKMYSTSDGFVKIE